MRSLPQFEIAGSAFGSARTNRNAWPALSLLVAGTFSGCAGIGASAPPPPPPPSAIQISVKPATGTVLLGSTQLFIATVSGTTDGAVTWSVNGAIGGNAATGTIATDGT